jgi:hypothetical protein
MSLTNYHPYADYESAFARQSPPLRQILVWDRSKGKSDCSLLQFM